ncbi:MAG: hypothetical protein ABIW46_06410 [Acidimicrobiales bacterium]
MQPAALAVLESQLLRSVVDLTLADEVVRRAVETKGVLPTALAHRLTTQRALAAAASQHAPHLYKLAVRREALAEAIRVVHDPEREYYLGGRPWPAPDDLISDHLNPAVYAVTRGALSALWHGTSTWEKPPRVICRTLLAVVLAPVAVAALGLAAIRAPSVVLAVAAIITAAVAVAYGAGLAQRMRHRAASKHRLSFPEWLARRSSSGFEANLDNVVEQDVIYLEARRQERLAWDAAEAELVRRHVMPAALRALEGDAELD